MLGLGGLALPGFLRLREANAAAGRQETSVILLWLSGGPSHMETWDPKPDAPGDSAVRLVPSARVCRGSTSVNCFPGRHG